jgi:hypothetical protein
MTVTGAALADIERVFREEYGRAVAVLIRIFGDIDTAEDAVQDAFAEAARRWPAAGLPPSPAGWIITTARNRAIDCLRREAARADKHAQAALLHCPAGASGGLVPPGHAPAGASGGLVPAGHAPAGGSGGLVPPGHALAGGSGGVVPRAMPSRGGLGGSSPRASTATNR